MGKDFLRDASIQPILTEVCSLPESLQTEDHSLLEVTFQLVQTASLSLQESVQTRNHWLQALHRTETSFLWELCISQDQTEEPVPQV